MQSQLSGGLSERVTLCSKERLGEACVLRRGAYRWHTCCILCRHSSACKVLSRFAHNTVQGWTSSPKLNSTCLKFPTARQHSRFIWRVARLKNSSGSNKISQTFLYMFWYGLWQRVVWWVCSTKSGEYPDYQGLLTADQNYLAKKCSKMP